MLLQFPEVRAAGLRGLVSREISQATSSLLSRFSKDSKPYSILDPRFARESRIEDRVSILVSQKTVNLHLGGTVPKGYNTFLKQFVSNGFALSSCRSFNFTVHVRYLVSVECVDYDTDLDGFL